jgi:hypothetical protein
MKLSEIFMTDYQPEGPIIYEGTQPRVSLQNIDE